MKNILIKKIKIELLSIFYTLKLIINIHLSYYSHLAYYIRNDITNVLSEVACKNVTGSCKHKSRTVLTCFAEIYLLLNYY